MPLLFALLLMLCSPVFAQLGDDHVSFGAPTAEEIGGERTSPLERRPVPALEIRPDLGFIPSTGNLVGTKGEAVTISRASTQTCANEDGTLTLVANNQPCVTASKRVRNLMVRSNEFVSASWPTQGTGSVTTDGTLCPDGTTAHKLTVDGPASGNDVYQLVIGEFAPSVAIAPSIYVRRVSTSGTLSIQQPYGSTLGATDIDLSAIGSDWVRFRRGTTQAGISETSTWNSNASGSAGMHFVAGAGGPLSFYACHAQLEAGSVASEEIVTTTTVPVSRHFGHTSLVVEPLGDNLLADNSGEALDGASWLVDGTPTRTANTWDSGSGSATGETIDDDNGAALEGVYQNLGTASGTYTMSCYMQAGTSTTANFRFNTDGTGSAICNFSGLSSVTQRKTCTATIGGVPTFINAVVYPGQNTTDTGSIKVDKCQVESGSVATSYTGTARAAQTTTVATPAGLSRTEGAAKICITPSWTGNSPKATSTMVLTGNAALSVRFFWIGGGSGSIFTHDGTSSPGVVAGFTADTEKCYRASWSALRNVLTVENPSDGTTGTTSAFTSFPAFDAALTIGSATDAPSPIKVRIPCMSSIPDGCR